MTVDIQKLRAAHEALEKAGCSGALTVFPKEGIGAGRALVQIPCDDYVALIQWIAYTREALPELLSAYEYAEFEGW